VQAGRLAVGAMHTMGPVDLSLLLATFHDRHPAVELIVREQSSEELAAMLREDEVDLAFLSVTERIQHRGLALRPLVSEELVVVLAISHPLAGRPELRIADLAHEPFITFREGARLREPHIALESNESRRIRSLVSRGLGVAILPRSDAEAPGSIVAVCDLVDPPLTRDVTLASRAERRPSPAAEAFRALALEVYGGP
jgi:DNA-binding transcriptional LysR family regulator